MKIAIASDKGQVSPHFGYCEGFTIYEVNKDNVITNKVFLANPGHKPGLLPNLLSQNNVDLVIAGGMGQNAVSLFKQKHIQVIIGVEGEIQEVIESFLRGDLNSSDSACTQHSHHDHHSCEN